MQFVIIACALLGVALGQYVGYTGYPGYAGYPGYTGYLGYAGNPGYAGYPGVAGYKGYYGYPGYNGYQGYQGYNGYPGYYAKQFQPLVPAVVKPGVAESNKTVVPVVPVLPAVTTVPVVAPIVPILPKEVHGGPHIAIRSQAQESYPDGSYGYSYQTDNGISAGESGTPSVGPNGPEKVVHGEYSYVAPDGQLIQVRYTADANGFHPEGTHLPGNHGYVTGVGTRAIPIVAAPVTEVEVTNPSAKSE